MVFFEPLADAEHVSVGVPYVHFPDVPRHVGRVKRDVEPCGCALPVDFINIVYPHRHPGALVQLIGPVPESRSVGATAAASLATLAEKDLTFA